MEFPQPLVRGRLVSRYKRFLADVVLDDAGPVTAHIANPGKMLGLLDPGAVCWLSRSTAPGRKLPWSVELIEAAGTAVCVNTGLANAVAAEAVLAGHIPELAGYAALRREVRYGDGCRVDLLLEGGGGAPCWVEVKSVTLSRTPGLAEWPDCVSARGAKHMTALVDRVRAGDRAVVLFLAQRSDCERFALASDLDAAFAAALRQAAQAGVEVLAYACHVSPTSIRVDRLLARQLTDAGAPVWQRATNTREPPA
jgi:sugar fermentation stimulation protein A